MKVLIAAMAGLITGFLAALAIANIRDTGEASENKRALAEARNISDALEKYRASNGAYPPLERGLSEAASYLQPKFIRHVQLADAYGQPYLVFVDQHGAAVVSTGRNGFMLRKGVVFLPADKSLGDLR